MINHPRALASVLETIGPGGIVQAYVGHPENEYTAAIFTSRPPKNEAVMVMKRELLQGTSVRIEPCSDPDLTNTVKSWGGKDGGDRPLQHSVSPDRESGPVCFEINARFSGTAGVRYLFGFNDMWRWR